MDKGNMNSVIFLDIHPSCTKVFGTHTFYEGEGD